MSKKIYYAHPVSLYGTELEEYDIKTLETLGFEVVNPNTPEHAEAYKRDGMEHFKKVVQSCDALAFRAFPGGEVPAGIYKEVIASTKCTPRLPVIELPNWSVRAILNVDETRAYLRESTGKR